MATYSTLSALFTAIADAIRDKTGDTATIVADNFPSAIAALNVIQNYDFTISIDSYPTLATAPPTGSYTCEGGATWADIAADVGLTVNNGYLVFVSTHDLTIADPKTGSESTTTYTTTFTLIDSAGTAVLTTDEVVNGAAYTYTYTTTS